MKVKKPSGEYTLSREGCCILPYRSEGGFFISILLKNDRRHEVKIIAIANFGFGLFEESNWSKVVR